jgi:D-amino peptidase
LNGQDIGESEIFAIRAGELGVPVGLVTGDQIVGEQLRKRVPQVEVVEVKRALSNVAGDVIPPPRARELIQAGARRAVERASAGELAPYRDEPAPYTVEVVLRSPASDALRANLELLPEFELVEEDTVRTTADDMDLGFRRIAYLGYGGREGVTRY